jgi:hypothetical protein
VSEAEALIAGWAVLAILLAVAAVLLIERR